MVKSLELRMCGSKKRFISEKKANDAKRGLEHNRDPYNKHNVYLCPYCHFWHIGRDDPKGEKS